MHRSKVYTILILSVTSLALLVVLQVLWLTNSYEKAAAEFHALSSEQLRKSVFALRDSTVIKSIETVPDSFAMPVDSIVFGANSGVQWTDSIRVKQVHQAARVEVYASSERDSMPKEWIRVAAPRMQEMRMRSPGGTRTNFVIRLGPDTLNLDSIAAGFRRNLAASQIHNPFEVRQMPRPTLAPGTLPFDHRMNDDVRPFRSPFADSLVTDAARLSPFVAYEARLSGVRATLMRQIAPQLAFSGFATLLTIVSFVVLFRNVRAQQRLLEMKNDLVNNITHELKTPISTVSVALEALKNFDALNNPRVAHEYLDMAQRELNRLSLLTDNILKSSLFEGKQLTLASAPLDLGNIVQEVVRSLRFVFEKANADVHIHLSEGPCMMSGDSVHLTNMVYNVIDNALKYSEGRPHISIEVIKNAREIELRVSDRGIGIPAEYRKKVFDKFFRVPGGNIHTVKGYGLGLSYVAAIVKEHRGTIEVQSTEGKGSTFIVRFPVHNTQGS